MPWFRTISCPWLSAVRGQNARLAAKLTGWRIDILSESKYAQVRAEEEVAARVARSLAEEAAVEEAAEESAQNAE